MKTKPKPKEPQHLLPCDPFAPRVTPEKTTKWVPGLGIVIVKAEPKPEETDE